MAYTIPLWIKSFSVDRPSSSNTGSKNSVVIERGDSVVLVTVLVAVVESGTNMVGGGGNLCKDAITKLPDLYLINLLLEGLLFERILLAINRIV